MYFKNKYNVLLDGYGTSRVLTDYLPRMMFTVRIVLDPRLRIDHHVLVNVLHPLRHFPVAVTMLAGVMSPAPTLGDGQTRDHTDQQPPSMHGVARAPETRERRVLIAPRGTFALDEEAASSTDA